MVNEQRLVTEFMELVKIDSESRHERRVADVLRQKLEQLGLVVVEDNAGSKVGSDTGNLVATLKGNQEVTPIFFGAHMDTVQPGQGIEPILEDGIIRSAGDTVLGSDDKAGIVAILEALRVVKEKQINHGDVQVIFTISEETGLLGAKYLDYNLVQAKYGYVLDTDGKPGCIVVRGPAADSLDVGIVGKPAHAGTSPEEGISAIQVAARAIDKMQLGRIDGETTANIGVIAGGKATNIIPDLVNLKGEARSLDPEKLANQVQHMVDVFEATAKEFGAKVVVNVEHEYPAVNLAEDSPVVQVALTAAKKLGFPTEIQSTGGGSDANILVGNGIPTGNLGVGMTKVHTTEEQVAVEDMVNAAKLLVAIMENVQ